MEITDPVALVGAIGVIIGVVVYIWRDGNWKGRIEGKLNDVDLIRKLLFAGVIERQILKGTIMGGSGYRLSESVKSMHLSRLSPEVLNSWEAIANEVGPQLPDDDQLGILILERLGLELMQEQSRDLHIETQELLAIGIASIHERVCPATQYS